MRRSWRSARAELRLELDRLGVGAIAAVEVDEPLLADLGEPQRQLGARARALGQRGCAAPPAIEVGEALPLGLHEQVLFEELECDAIVGARGKAGEVLLVRRRHRGAHRHPGYAT
jgi:hypothetical protein